MCYCFVYVYLFFLLFYCFFVFIGVLRFHRKTLLFYKYSFKGLPISTNNKFFTNFKMSIQFPKNNKRVFRYFYSLRVYRWKRETLLLFYSFCFVPIIRRCLRVFLLGPFLFSGRPYCFFYCFFVLLIRDFCFQPVCFSTFLKSFIFIIFPLTIFESYNSETTLSIFNIFTGLIEQ